MHRYLTLSSEEPVLLTPEINNALEMVCKDKNIPYQLMQSGAGHDAMNMTRLCPVGLLFVPSVDGISHHPNEYTAIEDILIGIDVLEEAVLRFAVVE